MKRTLGVLALLMVVAFASMAQDTEPKAFSPFLGTFPDWTPEETAEIVRVASGGIKAFSEEKYQEMIENGKRLRQSHAPAVDGLLKEFKTLTQAPLHLPDESALPQVLFQASNAWFKPLRQKANGLKNMAISLHAEGETEKALKLLFLVIRLGQHIDAGWGEFPTPLHFAGGIGVQNLALDEAALRVLREGNLPAKTLSGLARLFQRLATELPLFRTVITSSCQEQLSYLDGVFSDPEKTEKAFQHPLDAESRARLLKKAKAMATEFHQSLLTTYETEKTAPGAFLRKAEALIGDALAKAEPSALSAVLDEEGTILAMLVYNSVPSTKILQMQAQTRLRLTGFAFLAGYRAKGETTLPTKGLPEDLFSSDHSPCRVQTSPAGLVLYSVGPDGIDDGGDGEKDFIILPRPRS